ncbi:MAG: acyl-CoA dehydrogenase family protein [Hyphomonadaceae bacterium]|nr:acyl-CoA dehydrogenase family protein [Hyphomonadaceae bacterium]
MNLEFSPEEIAFRDQVRAFIRDNLPDHLRGWRASDEKAKEDFLVWHRILHKQGWIAPAWPVEYGGTGWTPTQRYIFAEECARAETPFLVPFGLSMVGPVIYTFGTPAQKERFLPRILSGEDFWCQGYSEPGAGSDLAGLSTRAELKGDHYIVNGQKTWTTLAHHADWGFFLVRTDPAAKKQEGISFLLIDMKTPGVTVRPIIMLDGGHEVNDVFLEDVKVPVANRIGEENKGWTYAKFLLLHERSGIANVARSKNAVRRLKEIARAESADDGGALIDTPDFRRKMADLEIDLAALEYTELRVLANEQAGRGPGVESSLLKIKGTEIQQRLTELTLEAVGNYASPDFRSFPETGGNEFPIGPDYANPAAPMYFNMRKTSIFGGSNEIQRNIIAKMVLGL